MGLVSAGWSDRKAPLLESDEVARKGMDHQFVGSDAQAEERLHELLADAVSGNMVSDVPIGAFLSGGIELIDCGWTDGGGETRAGKDFFNRLS